MSKNHWVDQMLLLNLTTHYIFFGISIYLSYFRLQLLQSPLYKLLKEFPLFSGAHCLISLGQFQCNMGWTKRKLIYLLPLLGISDPMAASSPPAQQLGLALRWAGCSQCCAAKYSGILMDFCVYQSSLPPDLKHSWEQAKHCRNFGGFKSFWVRFWRAVGGCQEQNWFVM